MSRYVSGEKIQAAYDRGVRDIRDECPILSKEYATMPGRFKTKIINYYDGFPVIRFWNRHKNKSFIACECYIDKHDNGARCSPILYGME